MLRNLKKSEKGFTIIEVLIVLAIAGLIMLVVFLAVPALQRNQRNSSRSSDASLIGGAVSECLGNKNGQVSSCDTLDELEDVSLDTTKLRQLTDVNVSSGDPEDPGAGETNTANVGFTAKCNPAGDELDSDGSQRQAAILYRVEVAGNSDGTLRCLEI